MDVTLSHQVPTEDKDAFPELRSSWCLRRREGLSQLAWEDSLRPHLELGMQTHYEWKYFCRCSLYLDNLGNIYIYIYIYIL